MAEYSSLVTRLTVGSIHADSVQYVEKIKSLLPDPDIHYIKGEERKLSNGKWQPFKNKSTQFRFVREFPKIFDIQEANQYWENWLTKYSQGIARIKSFDGYYVELSYEITITGESYPVISYSGEFNRILGELKIELILYFYSEI